MPLKRCVNAEGKKGWSWGDGGCQVAGSDKESKKQAIRVGLKVAGPKHFSEIMKHDKASFVDYEGVQLAQAIYRESFPRGYLDEFTSAIANFFAPAKADDMMSDDGDGDGEAEADDDEVAEAINLGGGGGPQMGTDFAEKENFGKKKKDDDDRDSGDLFKVQSPAQADDGQNDNNRNLPLVEEGPGKKDDEVTPGGQFSNDGFRPHDGVREPNKMADTDKEAVITKDKNKKAESFGVPDQMIYGELDDKTNDRTKVIIPPYNKSASPESDPSQEVPDYTPPTREEMNGDNDQNHNEGSVGNLYHDDEEEATEASIKDYIAICFGTKAFISTEVRNHLDSKDFGDPSRKAYPVRDQKDLINAFRLLHFSDKPSEVKRNLIRIAHMKNLKLPSHMTHDSSCVI